jgi:acyl-CoA dehydrogenase
MAWDFSTAPAFAGQLAWMKDFVETEVYPLETVDWTREQWLSILTRSRR